MIAWKPLAGLRRVMRAGPPSYHPGLQVSTFTIRVHPQSVINTIQLQPWLLTSTSCNVLLFFWNDWSRSLCISNCSFLNVQKCFGILNWASWMTFLSVKVPKKPNRHVAIMYTMDSNSECSREDSIILPATVRTILLRCQYCDGEWSLINYIFIYSLVVINKLLATDAKAEGSSA